ncbi:MAG: methyltransferase [Deltaproteobacteria bacterium]|nr:methyltransferase [Deltaproteobacteria bacterium]
MLEHTLPVSVPLVPEVTLRLLTEECPLWYANEAEAARHGLSEPYWAFAWPGGQALARYVLDHPDLVRGRRVLDFGAGGAIEGIAAALAGARSVTAADLDPLACAAAQVNAKLNGVTTLSATSRDLVGDPGVVEDFDVILAGDVFYDADLARRGRAWLKELGYFGKLVLLGDPARGFLEIEGLHEVARYVATWDGDTTGTITRSTGVYTITS